MAKKTKTVKVPVNIKVDFDVPVPPIERHGGRRLKYPFDKLTQVGASFFWAASPNTLKNAAVAWSKRNSKGYKFETRSIEEEWTGEDGLQKPTLTKGTRIFRKE